MIDVAFDYGHTLLSIGAEPLRAIRRLRWTDRPVAAALHTQRSDLGCDCFTAPATAREPDDAAASTPDGVSRLRDETSGHFTVRQDTDSHLHWTLSPDSSAIPGTRLRVAFREHVRGQNLLGSRAFIWDWTQHPHDDTACRESPTRAAREWTPSTLPIRDNPEAQRDVAEQFEWRPGCPSSGEISELDLQVAIWSA